MNQVNASDGNRLAFLDNLRSLMVVLVLIFHGAASYGSKAEFWPFHELPASLLVDLFMFLGDVFMMAVLFFIAGFFALPSLRREGAIVFLRRKFKRLGIPWLVVTFLVLPLLDYLHYFLLARKQGAAIWDYGTHWLLGIKKFAALYVGWMQMDAYRNVTEHFYQRYMWFLSLLLLFFVLFVLVHALCGRKIASKGWAINSPGLPSVYTFFAAISAGIILLFGLIRFLLYPDFMGSGWFSLGNLVQFQLGKLVIYAGFFCLGCLAYSQDWFSGNVNLGQPWLWGVACGCLFGINMTLLKFLTASPWPPLGARLAFVIFYPAWSLALLGWFIALARRYWNRYSRLDRTLAANSYRMYLVHYVFPMTLPPLIAHWQAPTLLKFVLTASATALLSYAVSRYLLRPFPKIVVAGLAVFSLVLAAV